MYLTVLRREGIGLQEGRFFCYFVRNTQIWQQALGTIERSLCHNVYELHYLRFYDRNAYLRKQLTANQFLNILLPVSQYSFVFILATE